MDMLKELAQRLEFSYILHDSIDGNWGGKSAETQEWNGMVREITDGVSSFSGLLGLEKNFEILQCELKRMTASERGKSAS